MLILLGVGWGGVVMNGSWVWERRVYLEEGSGFVRGEWVWKRGVSLEEECEFVRGV